METNLKYYTVTEEREVKVWALDPLEAANYGTAAFRGRQIDDGTPDGPIIAPVRAISIRVTEDI